MKDFVADVLSRGWAPALKQRTDLISAAVRSALGDKNQATSYVLLEMALARIHLAQRKFKVN
jgi:hypothetical protein